MTGLKPKTQPAAQQRKLAFSTKTANGSETKGHSTQKPQSTQSAAPKENEKSQKEQILVDDDSGDATPEPSASSMNPDEDIPPVWRVI